MTRRAVTPDPDDEVPISPNIGTAIPLSSMAKKPDDSYRASKAGFRIKKHKASSS